MLLNLRETQQATASNAFRRRQQAAGFPPATAFKPRLPDAPPGLAGVAVGGPGHAWTTASCKRLPFSVGGCRLPLGLALNGLAVGRRIWIFVSPLRPCVAPHNLLLSGNFKDFDAWGAW